MMGYWGNMMGGWGYGYGGNGSYWWLALVMMAFELIFWVAIAVIVVRLLRGQGFLPSQSHSHSSALEILRERYAKGEIDTEEYNSRKQQLLHP